MVGFGRNVAIYNTIICKKAYRRFDVPIYVIYVESEEDGS